MLKIYGRKRYRQIQKANIIYAYIKIAQKAFDSYIKNKRYIEKEHKSEKLKEYIIKINELSFYLLNTYGDIEIKEANKELTEKVLKESELEEKLTPEEIKAVRAFLESQKK